MIAQERFCFTVRCPERDGLLEASDQRGNKHDENQYHGNLCQLALLLGREWFAVAFCHFDDHEQGDEQND